MITQQAILLMALFDFCTDRWLLMMKVGNRVLLKMVCTAH